MRKDEPLRVLLIEDDPDDADLVLRLLRRGLERPVDALRVDSEEALRAALPRFEPDIVLSDHSMPGYSGLTALRVLREQAPDLPFIFVSGTIGEEAAIEAVRNGAMDYVLKDNLRRLPSAVTNALALAAERRERRRTSQALVESEARFRSIVESTSDWIWESDAGHRVTWSNDRVRALLGLAPETVLGQPVWTHACEDTREVLRRCCEQGVAWRSERACWQHADGSLRWLDLVATPRHDATGAPCGFRGVVRDVTPHVEQEARIRQLARFHAVLSSLGNAVLRARDVPSVLHLACRLAVEQGQFRAAMVRLPDSEGKLVISAAWGDPDYIAAARAIPPAHLASERDRQRPQVRAFHGEPWISSDFRRDAPSPVLSRLADSQGIGALAMLPIGRPAWGVLSLAADRVREFDAEELAVLARIAGEIDHARDFIASTQRLELLAYRDPVTGLPNRSALEAALAEPLASGGLFAMIEIVRFRQFEDRGHALANALLDAVSQRLQGQLGNSVQLAHAGGPRFLAWHGDAASQGEALAALHEILGRSGREPLAVSGEDIHVRLRCGVAMAPQHGGDFESVERSASSGLAEAEHRDVPLFVFNDELRVRSERHGRLERELRGALAAGQFHLHLQPKFECVSGRLCGAEALLRWEHPELGAVGPAEFIPLLESSGVIVQAGRWVLREALQILARWEREGLGRQRIAVNVSARELREPGYLRCVAELMEEAGAPGGLDIEVTESLLMQNVDRAVEDFRSMRQLGCQIAIDDFGTGFSSLNYLSRLPADVLKVDRSFTRDLAESPETLALVSNIISLAHALGLTVVAEGVETEEQKRILALLRCDVVQGYLTGRPIPVEEFERRHLRPG